MAVYRTPPDNDPVAQWVARLNYVGQLCDEQAAMESLFEQGLPGKPCKPSKELQQLMANWQALANPASVPPPRPKQLSLF